MQKALHDQPFQFQALQLGTDAGLGHLGYARQFAERNRRPVFEDVGKQLARQIGQSIHARFVEWRHVVQQGF